MRAEVDPSARIQVRGLGELLAPATCAVCGNGTRPVYVDPSIFFDWEGQLYFCVLCTTEMAEVIGCLSPEQAEFLINTNKILADSVKELELVARKYELLRNALTDAGISVSVPDVDPASVGNASEPNDVKREHKLVNDAPTIPRTESLPKPAESVTVTGRNDSSRPTGSDEPTAPSKSRLNL